MSRHRTRRRLDRRGKGDRQEGARVHGDEGGAHHHQVLDRGRLSIQKLLPAFQDLNLGGLGYEGYGCAGGSQMLVGSSRWRWHASIRR
jgi:hypothetical protein